MNEDTNKSKSTLAFTEEPEPVLTGRANYGKEQAEELGMAGCCAGG